jgi:hypothetical protein
MEEIMYNRNPYLIKAAAALLVMTLFLAAALYLSGGRSLSGIAAAGVPTSNVPGSASSLPPTTVTQDKEGYTLWTVDWGSQSWCVPVSVIRYPFNLMGQDPTELSDVTLRLKFNEGAYHYVDDGSGNYVPVWDDASWGVALNGRPPNDWQLVGAIEAQPSGVKHWVTSDPIPIDNTLLIDGENNIWLQQHDNYPQEPGCGTCASTCIELKQVQLRAAVGLEIKTVSPSDGTRNVWFDQRNDSEIRVKFTTVVSSTSVNPETFQVYYFDQDVNKVYVDGDVRPLSGAEYAFVPKQSLLDGVQYIAQVWGKTEAEADDRDKWVMDTGGSPLEEGRTWTFWTIPQLQVKVVPVQVLEGMPLVQDKPTVLRTFIRWDLKPNVFWKSQAPSIEVEDVTAVWVSSTSDDNGAANWSDAVQWQPVRDAKTALRKREYREFTFAEESYTNREKWRSLDSVNYFGFTPHSTGSYQLTARVLVNDSRGVAHPFRGSVNVNVSSVHQFGVYMRAVAVGADYGKSGTVDLSAVIAQNLKGLLELYPVSSVNRPAAPSAMPYYTPTTSLWINDWSTEPASGWPKQYLLEEMSALCQRTTGCRAMVGLASPGWLVDGGLTLPEAAPWGALIKTDNVGPNHFVMAHEIGHLARFEHIEAPAGEGFNVATGADKRYSVDHDVFDFMAVDPVEALGKQLWISNEHYVALGLWTGAWLSQNEASVAGGISTDPRLLVSGAITETTGEVTLLPWYQMGPGEWQAPAEGPYALVFLDSGGGEIAGYSRNFGVGTTLKPAGSPSLDAGDRGLFAFTIPYPAATAKVQIRRASDNAVLKEISPSASAPTLSINPPGGAAWHGAQPITWQSDPGTRYFAVDISTDNGATWEALAINLTDTSFTLQTTALPNTTQTLVRVAATDGLRTTTANAGPFTIDNPPLVGYVSPSPGATGVGIYERITVGFRDAMDPATINGSTFTLAGGSSITVTGAVTYNAATRTATFTPQTPLAYATTYTARVTTGVHDSSSEALPAETTWSFTTETDRMPPQPLVFTPAAGVLAVPRNATLVVVWDQALNASTINTSTFRLAAANGNSINGTVTYNTTTHVATFTPDASLTADTIYIASLKAGIQDEDGNATQGDFNWSFTTGNDTVNPFGFTGACVDYGQETNGDGLYEQLVIKVGVQITATGAYTLGGTLTDAAGAEIAWASTGARGLHQKFLGYTAGHPNTRKSRWHAQYTNTTSN